MATSHLSVSNDIVDELIRGLRGKFGWSEEAAARAYALIAEFTERVLSRRATDVVVDDPSDNRILECAVAGASEFVVTGDRHLLRLGDSRVYRS